MIRYPLQTLLSKNITTTASVDYTFTFPNYDFDGIVGKLVAQTFTGSPATMDVYVQTSDDNGTTFYDVAHFVQLIQTITNANAYFLTIPVNIGDGKAITSPGSGSISANSVNGLPLLSPVGRVHVVWANATGTSAVNSTVSLMVNNQSVGR